MEVTKRPYPRRRRVLFWLASALAGASAILLTLGLLGVWSDDPEESVYWAAVLSAVPAVAIAYLPLRFSGTGFRVAAGIAGLVFIVGGVGLVILGIGLLLVPLGLAYLVLALMPGRPR